MKLTKAQIKGKQEALVGNLVNPVEKRSTTGACARPRKPPSRSIALRRLASVAAHRLGRQAVRRAPLVRHPSGTTARRTRKPPESVHENACFAGCTKRSEMLPLLPIPIPCFQLATLVLAIGNIYTLATFTHWFCKRLCRQSPLFRVARGAGGFVWPEGAFRVRRCGVARQGSRKVQRRRRGEASSREAARLH